MLVVKEKRARKRIPDGGCSELDFCSVGLPVAPKRNKKAASLPYPTHSGRTGCPSCRLFTSDKHGAKKLSKLFYCQIKKTKRK